MNFHGYTLTEARNSAIDAAFSSLKGEQEVTLTDVWKVLDDISRQDSELIASLWYREMTDNSNQTRLFNREVKKRITGVNHANNH